MARAEQCELDKGLFGQAQPANAARRGTMCGDILGGGSVQNVSKAPTFVGCRIGAVCFHSSLPLFVETFLRQVLNEESDIKGSARVLAAVLTYVLEMVGIQVRRKILF